MGMIFRNVKISLSNDKCWIEGPMVLLPSKIYIKDGYYNIGIQSSSVNNNEVLPHLYFWILDNSITIKESNIFEWDETTILGRDIALIIILNLYRQLFIQEDSLHNDQFKNEYCGNSNIIKTSKIKEIYKKLGFEKLDTVYNIMGKL